MTSQDGADRMEELLKEAKELKIKGAHFCKSEESLQKKIDEAKGTVVAVEEQPKERPVAPKAKRKPAPKMSVANVGIDARAALLNKLEAEDPECKYLFQPFGTTAEALAAKSMERTSYTLGNEIVCRTDREAYYAVVEAKNEMQRRGMDAIDPNGQQIKSLTSRAKELPTAR